MRAPATSPMHKTVSLQRWQSLTAAEQAAVLALTVTAQQVEYAGTVEQSVRLCQADWADEVAGLAIVADAGVAGFLLLKRGSQAPVWAPAQAATVSALRIGLAAQGMGLGSAALKVLPAWVARHWPDTAEIVLAVDEENHPARRAYANAGFVDGGRREPGRIGWVRYLAMPVGLAGTNAPPRRQS